MGDCDSSRTGGSNSSLRSRTGPGNWCWTSTRPTTRSTAISRVGSFHGYYDRYCYLPLYVFCGQQLLVAYVRPSNIDASKHAWPILSLLVKRLRKAWPGVRIVFRGRLGVLPAPDARLVRPKRCSVNRGVGPKRGSRTRGSGGVRGRPGRAREDGSEESVVPRLPVRRARLAASSRHPAARPGTGSISPPTTPRAPGERIVFERRRKEAGKALRWSGKSQKTPSGAIQAFHTCGTNFITYWLC